MRVYTIRSQRGQLLLLLLSQPELTMRAEAHKFEAVVIRLAVDENEIRPDVASRGDRSIRRRVGGAKFRRGSGVPAILERVGDVGAQPVTKYRRLMRVTI